MLYASTYESPFGALTLFASDLGLTGVGFNADGSKDAIPVTKQYILNPQAFPNGTIVHDDSPFQSIKQELDSYFNGKSKHFSMPIDFGDKGTAFQRGVWEALQDIPYGSVLSYGELATRIGNSRAARAVGLANNRNPLAIIVPCHRVIGANGSLVGYAGGIPFKRALLELEGVSLDSNDAKTTRGSILQAGAVEFARVGFSGARIDEIAVCAGVNKRMIYHHFGAKKGLYREILDHLSELGLERETVLRLKIFHMLEKDVVGESAIEPQLELRTQRIAELQAEGKIGQRFDPQRLAGIQYLIERFGDLLPDAEQTTGSHADVWPLFVTSVRRRTRLEPIVRRIDENN